MVCDDPRPTHFSVKKKFEKVWIFLLRSSSHKFLNQYVSIDIWFQGLPNGKRRNNDDNENESTNRRLETWQT